MASKPSSMFFIFLIFMSLSLPPIYACTPCSQPPYHRPSNPKNPHPKPYHPPHHARGGGGGGGSGGGSRGGGGGGGGGGGSRGGGGGGGGGGGSRGGGGGGGGHQPPPIVIPPPIISPPVITPTPPSTTYPPYTGPPPSGGGGGGRGGSGGSGSGQYPPPPPPVQPTCPIDALKLGLCVDVLGGLVHIGLGNPVENACCPVLGGLLELEAAICLCTTLRIKLLNLNIFIPLALQALITCGKNPPPGFVCPPLN